MAEDIPFRARLLLSLQRALLGQVREELRAVCCAWSTGSIQLRFIFDGPIEPDAAEDMRGVATEVIADFGDGVMIEEEILRSDFPEDLHIHALEAWAYWRKESPAD